MIDYAWDAKTATHGLTKKSVKHLVLVLSELPADAIILEIGCYIGGVLRIMSDCRPDCSVHGMDDLTWNGEIGKGHRRLPEGHKIFDLQGQSPMERFRAVVGERDNVTFHHARSPHSQFCKDWTLPLDMIHFGFDTDDYDLYMDNIKFWWAKIKNNGWISGQAVQDGRLAVEDWAAAHDCHIAWTDKFFAGRRT
jgi:hypothetical protein